MSRTRTLALLITLAFVWQSPAQDPVREATLLNKAPQALQSAELQFSRDGKKLLVVRHYTNRYTPLVTVVDTGPVSFGDGARYLYFPLVATNLYGKDEPRFGLEGVSAALSPDGNFLMTASRQTVRLWNITRGQSGQPRSVTIEQPGHCLAAFTRDGKRLLTVAVIGGKASRSTVRYEARFWDGVTGQPLGEPSTGVAELATGSSPEMKGLAWLPGEKSFLVSYSSGKVLEAEAFQLWDAATLKPMGATLRAAGDCHHVGPDGKTVLVWSKKAIALWDLDDGMVLGELPTPQIAKRWIGRSQRHIHAERWAAAHPDGNGVLHTTASGAAQLWDLNVRPAKVKLTLERPGKAYWVAIAPDGKQAATAYAPGEIGPAVLTWSLNSGKQLLSIPHDGRVRAMEFSPDGRVLATVSDHDVYLWRLDNKQ